MPPLPLLRAGRGHRRVWAAPGRADIEVRTASRPDSPRLARRVETELARLKGVQWAEVNGVLGRVLVTFDGDSLDLGDLLEVVEAAEERESVQDERFSLDRLEHPGDDDHIRRAMASLLADVAGIGLSAFGVALSVSPLPVELASLVTIVDNEPRLRRFIEEAVGAPAADVGLAMLNAGAQGIGQGPLGLLVDGLHRTGLLRESLARRSTWNRLAMGSLEPAERAGTEPIVHRPRPHPVPDGPIELYSDRAGLASTAGAAATLAATLNPRSAAAVLLAGIPKAARLGRVAFAANIGRMLAERGTVVAQPGALRVFDRIDTLCVEADLLFTGLVEVDHVEPVDDADHLEVQQRVRTLLDRSCPNKIQRRRGWAVGPLEVLNPQGTHGLRRALRRLGPVDRVIVLTHLEMPAAVFGIIDELAAGARELLDAAREAGHLLVVAGSDLDVVRRLGGDLLVDGGAGLAESVRMLQQDECCVALVANHDPSALRAADCSIAPIDRGKPPWGADLMVPGGVADAAFIVQAIGVAHEVSRQSVAVALAGTSVGSLVAVSGGSGSGSRALTSVNVAAMVALANSTRAAWALARRPTPVLTARPPWHEMDVQEVLDRLGTTSVGLTEVASSERRGPVARVLSAPWRFGLAVTSELVNPLTPVLIGGAALSAAVGSVTDAGVIGAVSALNALLGATQRFRAERAVDALEDAHAPTARVLQAGEEVALSGDLLVPGSVIVLAAGSVLPADARIIESSGLEVDEASLTGESLPVPKDSGPCLSAAIADRTSMLYEGTTIVAGAAKAVVVAVGQDTEAAVGLSVPDLRAGGTGVEARLSQLSARTLPFAAVGGIGVIASGMLRGQPLSRSLGTGVSLAVAAVPEGLPVIATLAQLSAARRLSTRGALVRNPRAIEALGRVEVLCTDKTGTLTEGHIALRSLSDGRVDRPTAQLTDALRFALAAATRASPEPDGPGPLPHPTDEATVDGARQVDVDTSLGLGVWSRVSDLPFEPSRGYHATLGRTEGAWLLSVKGAPELLLPRCRTRRTSSGRVPISPSARQRLRNKIEDLARRGLRVLAVAERVTESSIDLEDDEISNLEFLGFLAFSDPVRPSAAAAVQGLRAAGVDIVMVTGDHPSTAAAIATELGILDGRRVMTGAELERLEDTALETALSSVSVFARVTPADKTRIVLAYQRAGRSVAMTGDGANDAPAIRLADAGLALGTRSTPAARNAADVVITDDRIETVVDAIVEGRAMWRSVRDALAILLGGNIGEITFTVATSAITGRSPLSSRQILLVNLLTDVVPALAIAVRPPHNRSYDELLAEGPDRSLGSSLERAIASRAVTTAAGAVLAWTVASLTGPSRRADTVGLVALVGTQLGQTLTSGGSHPTVVAAAVGSALVLAGIVQTPGVSQFFGCTPLDPIAWSTAAGAVSAATILAWGVPRLVTTLGAKSLDGQHGAASAWIEERRLALVP